MLRRAAEFCVWSHHLVPFTVFIWLLAVLSWLLVAEEMQQAVRQATLPALPSPAILNQ